MLKASAGRLNQKTLDVWQQMLAFVRQEDVRDPDRVNLSAGRWAGVVHTACLQTEDELARLFPDPPR